MIQDNNTADKTKAPIDYDRLLELSDRVNRHQASKEEKDELIEVLRNDGKLQEQQYLQYKRGQEVDSLINFAVSVAVILLLGHTIKDLVTSRLTH
jgi:hypothetical protein